MAKKIKYRENCLGVDEYFELRKSVNWRIFDKMQTQRALDNSIFDIVVFEGIKPIGMGRLIGDGSLYYYIQDVVVHPQYQRQGIGSEIIKKLTEYVEETTTKDGRASIVLISEKEKEIFYQKLGFKSLPNSRCGAGMRKIILKTE